MGEKIISLNTRGFVMNRELIQKFVDHHDPKCFVANEHKQEDLKNLYLDGYKCAAAFPATNGNRGTAVFVRNDVAFKTRPDLDRYSRAGEFEVASVDIPSENLTVTGHYRTPAARSITEYNRRLDDFCIDAAAGPPGKKLAIAGDFNLDTSASSSTKNVLRINDVQFNVRSPTHEQGRCLDNFATNFQPAKSRVMTGKMASEISDHLPIMMELPSGNSYGRKTAGTYGSARSGGSGAAAQRPPGGGMFSDEFYSCTSFPVGKMASKSSYRSPIMMEVPSGNSYGRKTAGTYGSARTGGSGAAAQRPPGGGMFSDEFYSCTSFPVSNRRPWF